MPTQPTDEVNYETVGFDKFLSRAQKQTQEVLEDESSLTTSQVPSGNIMYGEQASPDGKMKVNWNGNTITFSDGAIVRVRIGYFAETGTYGIKVYHADGTVHYDGTS
jgi:hypothetical protein